LVARPGPGRSSLVYRITRLLYEYDINLAGLAGTTHPAKATKDLDYHGEVMPKQKLAAIKLRLEVPLHRKADMETVATLIQGMDSNWEVSLTDNPGWDLAPAWPSADGQPAYALKDSAASLAL
jgi:hypothetical protein